MKGRGKVVDDKIEVNEEHLSLQKMKKKIDEMAHSY